MVTASRPGRRRWAKSSATPSGFRCFGSCDFELPRSSSPSPCRCCWPRPASGAFPGANGRMRFVPGEEASSGPSAPRSFGPVRSIADIAAVRLPRAHASAVHGDRGPARRRWTCSIEYRSPTYSPNGRLIAFDAGRRLAPCAPTAPGCASCLRRPMTTGSRHSRRTAAARLHRPRRARERLVRASVRAGPCRRAGARLTRAAGPRRPGLVRGRIAFSLGTGLYAIRPSERASGG